MEKFQELREIAKKKINLADHILTQTYPLLKDPKLLVSVIENIFLAYTNAIGSLLHYERLFKRVPQFQDTFESKWRIFINECAHKYKIKQSELDDIRMIKSIIIKHKKSPMEFVRDGRFVICSGDYKIDTISFDELKKLLLNAKVFIANISNIVSKHEYIFKR